MEGLSSLRKGGWDLILSFWNYYAISVHKVYLVLCLFRIYFNVIFIAIFLVAGISFGDKQSIPTGSGTYQFDLLLLFFFFKYIYIYILYVIYLRGILI